jgi:cytidylate kinase
MKKIFQLINRNIANFVKNGLTVNKSSPEKNLALITISRERGSGGKIIAYQVAKKLRGRWRVYHKEIIDEIAKNAHLKKELIQEIDEKKLSLIDQIIDDFFGKKYLSLSRYQKLLTKTIAQIAQRGYVVIVDRGAEYLAPHALKVRIICEMNQRIENMMKFEGMTKEEAIESIRKSDEKRAEFIKTLYHHDIKKAHHYDLVIRTSKDLSIDDAASLIVLAAKTRFKL